MEILEKENPFFDPQYAVVLEESAVSLTKGLHGRVPEGWNQPDSKERIFISLVVVSVLFFKLLTN